MKKILYLVPVALLVPVVTFAQGDLTGVTTFAQNIIEFINGTLVPFIFAVAFIVFIWGIFTYFIRGGADEGKRDEGKQLMLWGIIGFVVMVSVWGIVNLLANGLGFTNDVIETPTVPGVR